MTISKLRLPWRVKAINWRHNFIAELYVTADGDSVYRLEHPDDMEPGWEVFTASGKHLGSYDASTTIEEIAADYGWEVL